MRVFGQSRQLEQDVVDHLDVFAADQQGFGLRDRDGMHQGGVGEIGIDQRGDDTDTVQTAADEQVVGTAIHQERHDIAPLQTLPDAEVGVLIRARVDLLPGPAFVLIREAHLVRCVGRELLGAAGRSSDGRTDSARAAPAAAGRSLVTPST